MRDIAWAAGLYEGEGSCSMTSRGYPRICLGMTDREPVDWFKEVLGFGYIWTKKYPDRKPMHRYEAGGWVRVQEVYDLFAPYLSPRRKERIVEVLSKRKIRPSSPDCEAPSAAGYRRHIRSSSPPCQLCREANRDYERQRRGRIPRYPKGDGYS